MLLMGKSTISMAIFNSFMYVFQRVIWVLNKHGRWKLEDWGLNGKFVRTSRFNVFQPTLQGDLRLDIRVSMKVYLYNIYVYII